MTPKPLLQVTGNSLLKGVLGRIKQRLLNQLLMDYYHWVDSQSELIEPQNSIKFGDPCTDS